MLPLRDPTLPVSTRVPAEALARGAVELHAPWILTRGGPAQRAANLVDRGVPVGIAANEAAKQGKGHIGELQQSASYSAVSGSRWQPLRARPNPVANDRAIDVEVRAGRRLRTGAQVKVGTPAYVRRAVRQRGAPFLIVNAEARRALVATGEIAPDVLDRLQYGEIESSQLTAADSHAVAAGTLERMLSEDDWFPSAFEHSFRAGARATAESFATGMIHELAISMICGETFDPRLAARRVFEGALRAGAKAAVQTGLLLDAFLERAGEHFSSRLLHRISRSTVVLGAIAEVIVETAIDVHAVLTGEMTFEDLLRRFGVHVCTAAGAAAGAALAIVLTGGAAVWVQAVAGLVGAYAGGRAGRHVGNTIFSVEPRPLLAR